MSTETEDGPIIPRIPAVVWKDLRKKLKRMDKGFDHLKNAEACAFAIQRLQHEFRFSKEFHIGIAPEPGKLILLNVSGGL